MMKMDTTSPCASCPYRKDVPVKTWHADEFRNLLANQDAPMGGNVFGCHKYRNRPKEEQHVCAGWFLDQRKNNYPSLVLRMMLMDICSKAGEDVTLKMNDGGHELYASVKAMCNANGVRAPRFKRPSGRFR